MSIVIDGTGTISGVSATGITTAQTVGYSSLPAGSVLQVVNATYSTATSTTSGSLVNTGLTATITPKFATSKILVIVDQVGCGKQTSSNLALALIRNSTTLINFETIGAYTNTSNPNYIGTCSANYLDSPATTSATTYKTQFSSGDGTTAVWVQQINGPSCTSTITLLEIAQ
jgi:hypothetical protein